MQVKWAGYLAKSSSWIQDACLQRLSSQFASDKRYYTTAPVGENEGTGCLPASRFLGWKFVHKTELIPEKGVSNRADGMRSLQADDKEKIKPSGSEDKR